MMQIKDRSTESKNGSKLTIYLIMEQLESEHQTTCTFP